VQHQNDIVFPFRRFHIGPVWRADRPAKGRYQEFYQCDADIIGSTSLINEVELTKIYVDAFKALGLDVTIKVNNRKVLDGIVNVAGCPQLLTEVTVAIDKFDKIGLDGVRRELGNAGLSEPQIASILEADTLQAIKAKFEGNETGLNGVAEMDYVFNLVDSANVKFDVKLARGLNYYTGTIWEVAANGVQMGSIASGGRYDNLTEMFGGSNMSGVGISFGIERIYDVMEELNLFPENIAQGVKILFVPRDASNEEYAFKLATIARSEGISAEVFLGKAKKNKHFGYAATKGIHYMVEVGDNEQQSRHFRLRNVVEHKEEGTGFSLEELMQFLKQ
jgi:histidyl-tRNA synthetase